jgi:hypothetical protein
MYKQLNLTLLILLAVLVGQVWSSDVNCYQVNEFVFNASTLYFEPWNDVNFVANFTGPGGITFDIQGFWDGGIVWKIRFAPTVPGQWNYQTTCLEDSALNGHSGSFLAGPAAGDNPLFLHGGFLRLSDNSRYLTYTDGKPFFWLGDTWWYAPGDYMPFDGSSNPAIASCFKHCVDKRKSQGYTIAHFGFLGDLKGNDFPLEFYLTHDISLGYWQETDKYINYIVEQGIMPQIAMNWNMNNTLDDWKIIWRYFIARYGAYPITWDHTTEYNGPGRVAQGSVEPTLALGQFIKDIDPYKRAMTVMPWWFAGADSDPNFNIHWEQPWHDFTQVNGAHENPYSLPVNKFREAYDYVIPNPFVLVETTFEGIQRYAAYPPYDDYVVRRNFLRVMQCGGNGFTYGAHGLWYPTQHENDHMFEDVWGDSIPWWDALERPGGEQIGYIKNFYESIPWWKLEPRFDAITTVPPLQENYRVLAQASSQDEIIVVYFPHGVASDMSVDYQLQSSRNNKYQVTWFNPRTGLSQRSPENHMASGLTVTLPSRMDNEDWILLLLSPRGDVNGDGEVDYRDLAIIGNNWLEGPGPYSQ